MYAIVRTGGKQYRVEEGRSVVVERLPAEEGETVELKDVLLIAEDGSVTVGSPVIDGARVLAEVEANGRSKKIVVFKYKAKVRARKKTGHRQAFTRLAVREILLPGQQAKTEKPKRRRAKEEEPLEAVAEPPVVAPEAEVAAEAAPKPRTRRAAPVAKAAPAEAAPKPRTRRAAPAAEPKGEKPKATRRAPRKPAEPKAGAAEDKPKRAPRRKAPDAEKEEK